MDPLGAAASALTLLEAAKALFKLVREFKHAPAELVVLAKEVTDWKLAMHNVCKLTQDRDFLQRHGDNLRRVVAEANIKITMLDEFVQKLHDTFALRSFGRIKWLSKHKKKALRCLEELATTRESLMTLLSAHAAFDSHTALRSLEHITTEQRKFNSDLSEDIKQLALQSKTSDIGVLSQFSNLRQEIMKNQEENINIQRENLQELNTAKLQLQELAEHFTKLYKDNSKALAEHRRQILSIMNDDTNQHTDPMPENSKNSSTSQVTLVTQRRKSQMCQRSCPCSCHNQVSLRTPTMFKGMIGFLFVSYYGTSPGTNSCSIIKCKNTRRFEILATYCFPQWLIATAFTIAISNIQSEDFTIRLRATTFTKDGKLHYLTHSGNIHAVQRILKSKTVHIDERENTYGQTALWIAVETGNHHIAQFLLLEGANPNAQDYYRNTPKGLALSRLVEYRNSPPTANEPFASPQLLKECFWDETERWSSMEYTILHEIVLGVREEKLENELQRSTETIDETDICGYTALSLATRKNDVQSMRILLRYGADPDIGDNEGSTPIVFAHNPLRETTAMQLLLQHHASVKAVRSTGFTPLLQLVWFQDGPEFIVPLIEAGNDPNDKEVRGESCLCRAAMNDKAETAKVLIGYGADINSMDARGFSIVANCIYHAAHEALKVILDNGAEYTTLNKNRQNILHIVASSEKTSEQTLEILHSYNLKGLNANARDCNGCTPLDLLKKRQGLELDKESFKHKFYSLIDSVKPRRNFHAIPTREHLHEDIIEMSLLG